MKSFRAQADALAYAANHPLQFVWTVDLVPGKQFKSFLVASVSEFFAWYIIQPPYERHHYELIPEDVPVKAFFDLDIKAKELAKLSSNNSSPHEAVQSAFAELKSVLAELLGPECLRGSVPSTATTDKKGSVHFVAPQAVFSSMAHLKHWVKSALVPRLSPDTQFILDTGIYTKIRQFRLLWSEKLGGNNHLELKRADPRDERQLFLDSLVSYFDPNNPPLDFVPVQLPEFAATSSSRPRLGRAGSSELLVYPESGTVVEPVHGMECCHAERVHNNNRILRLYDFRSSCQVSYRCLHPNCPRETWIGPPGELKWRPVAELYYSTIMPGADEYQIDGRKLLNGRSLLDSVGLDIANSPVPRLTSYIRSPKASGKTHALKELVAQIHPSFTVLVISGLCSLADMYMTELNAHSSVPFEDYRTLGPHPFPPDTRRMVCSLESIWKVTQRPHVVILDESETIFSRLPGATFDRNRTPVLTRLRELFQGADVLLALDADMSPRSYNFIQAARPNAHTIVHANLTRELSQPRNFVLFPAEDRWWAHFKDMALSMDRGSGHLALVSNCKSATNLAAQVLAQIRPDLSVLCINADTRTRPEVAATLRNVNEAWVQPDVLLYSPTVGAGISFDVPSHFDRVFVYATGDAGTVRDLRQQIGRIRSPAVAEVCTWLPRTRDNRPTNPDVILANAIAPWSQVKPPDLATEQSFSDILDRWSARAYDTAYAELWSSVKAEAARDWNNFAGNFVHRLTLDGATITEWEDAPGDEEGDTTMADAREAVSIAEAEAFAALPLDPANRDPQVKLKVEAWYAGFTPEELNTPAFLRSAEWAKGKGVARLDRFRIVAGSDSQALARADAEEVTPRILDSQTKLADKQLFREVGEAFGYPEGAPWKYPDHIPDYEDPKMGETLSALAPHLNRLFPRNRGIGTGIRDKAKKRKSLHGAYLRSVNLRKKRDGTVDKTSIARTMKRIPGLLPPTTTATVISASPELAASASVYGLDAALQNPTAPKLKPHTMSSEELSRFAATRKLNERPWAAVSATHFIGPDWVHSSSNNNLTRRPPSESDFTAGGPTWTVFVKRLRANHKAVPSS